MKLYGNPGSGSACVEAVLSELDIGFERASVEYGEDGIIDETFISINPRRQIPALVLNDGTCLTESAAILMYLADANPRSNLAPEPGSLARARLDQWLVFMVANIYEGELRRNYPHRYVVGNPRSVAEIARNFLMTQYRLMENSAGDGPYFFGATFTILDVYIWMLVNWDEEHEVFRKQCPRMFAIAQTVKSRPKIAPIHAHNFGGDSG